MLHNSIPYPLGFNIYMGESIDSFNLPVSIPISYHFHQATSRKFSYLIAQYYSSVLFNTIQYHFNTILFHKLLGKFQVLILLLELENYFTVSSLNTFGILIGIRFIYYSGKDGYEFFSSWKMMSFYLIRFWFIVLNNFLFFPF